MSDGWDAGVILTVDTRWVGFDANIDALAQKSVTGSTHNDIGDPAAWGSAHITWSVISASWIRIRALTGASMLALPKTTFTESQPWAGDTLFGPDVGFSGGIGLHAPVTAEGWARLTPFPTRIVDAYAGLGVHGGPIGLTAGWRWVEVHGNGTDAPTLNFSGPQGGLSFRF
ncbi:MAG TPA: hypothetical protein VFG53_13850 [Anaeromyxobacter sp.]|nr:hypothetical protein [Anaeromyxobacter sp.]